MRARSSLMNAAMSWSAMPYSNGYKFPDHLEYSIGVILGNGNCGDYFRKKVQGEMERFFGLRLDDFLSYVRSFGFAADFVAKKDGEIYIVKVKSESGLRYLDKKTLDNLRWALVFNLKPLLVTINVSFEVTDLKINAIA